MNEQRNLFVAMVLVVAILVGFNYFYDRPKTMQAQQNQESVVKPNDAKAVSALSASDENKPLLSREDAIKTTKRITINTPKISGSINLTGGIIDDIQLKGYKETTDPKSDDVTLLSPKGTKEGYFGSVIWKNAPKTSNQARALPSLTTEWQLVSGKELSLNNPIKLTFNNGEGLIFERTISVDDDYLFTIEDRLINKTGNNLSFVHEGVIERHDIPLSAQGGYILHEGPIGVMNGKLQEVAYNKLEAKPEYNKTLFSNVQKSWAGFTDKYWLTAIIPTSKVDSTFSFVGDDKAKHYQIIVTSSALEAKSQDAISSTMHLFAGAKILSLLDQYETKLGIEKFDLAVDFGWFYFLTKPLLYFLQWMNTFLGNFGLSIIVLTILAKLALFPMANKSYRSMARMKSFQPQIAALKERYGDDKMQFNQAMMELYKKEKINPASGCLPMLIQAPVFFCLYKVLYVCLDMRHAPFFGWIQDLSAPDPTSFLNLFGLLPFNAPNFLQIGALPLIMGITMFLQQKMNPQPADKAQEIMFLLMPLMMTFLFASFPAGLVIYWTWSNILGIVQQWAIMRMTPASLATQTKKGKNA